MKQRIIGLTAAVFVTLGSVMAASIPVSNAGFESPVLDDGATLAVGTGGTNVWYEVNGSAWPPAYYFNPAATDFSSVPEGANIALLDCRPANGIGSIAQTNVVAIDEAKVYTLRVKVGRSITTPFPPEYSVALLKGDEVAAHYITTTAPAAGSWVEITVTYTPMPGDGGKMLGIRLGNLADLTDAVLFFDDVRLSDATRITFYKEYSRNLYALEGATNGSFSLAVNDSPGTWTILVTDVATGTTVEKTFSVLTHPSAAVAPARGLTGIGGSSEGRTKVSRD